MMKAYFPDKPREGSNRLPYKWKNLGKILIIILLSCGMFSIHSSSTLLEAEYAVFGSFQRAQSYRSPPKSVLVVRLVEGSGTEAPWPPSANIAKGISLISGANPKAVFVDFSLDEEEFSVREKEEILHALKKTRTAIATESVLSRSDPTKRLRFAPSSDFLDFGHPYVIDINNMIAFDLSFASESSASENSFLGALTKITRIKPVKDPKTNLINFYGPAGTIESISLSELLTMDNKAAKNLIQNRIVFLGFESLYWQNHVRKGDVSTAVFEKSVSDTEIRATIAANLMDGSFIQSPEKSWQILILFALLHIVFVISFFAERNAGIEILVGMMVAATALEFHLLYSFYYWVPGLVALCVAVFISLLINSAKTSVTGEKENDIFDFGKCKF